MQMNRFTHTQLMIILAIVAYFLLMFGNGIISLTHPDEVFYTQSAKEMLAHQSWFVPYIFDRPQFEKPIFFYWLQMIAIKIFGIHPFVARFWPAFFGIMGVLVTYGLAFLLYRDKRTAFLSGLVLSTSFIYVAMSRAVLTDMVFSIWVLLAISSFYLSYTSSRYKNTALMLFSLFCSLAVLTKGLLGIIFPLGLVTAFLFYKKDFTFLKSKVILWGALLFIILTIPWHILMAVWYKSSFTDEYFRNVHFRRIFEAEHMKSNTWYFYLLTIIAGVFPWSFYLLPAGYRSVKSLREKDGCTAFLILWIVLVFMIMHMAQSKLASYILPLFPAVAILLGRYFTQVTEKKDDVFLQRSIIFGSYVMSSALFIAAMAALFLSRRYESFVPDKGPVIMLMILAVFGSAVILFLNRSRHHMKTIVATASITAIVLISALYGHRYAEPWVSCKAISDVFNQIAPPGVKVLCSKFYLRGIRFYTDRETSVIDINGKGFFSPHPVEYLNSDDKVLAFLNRQAVTYGILKKGDMENLSRITGDRFATVVIKEIGGKYLAKIERLQ